MKFLLTPMLILLFSTVLNSCGNSPDTTAPVMTLYYFYDNTDEIEVYGTYIENSVLFSDEQDYEEATMWITGKVDTNVVGSYTLTYHAKDEAGNYAAPISRTVTVVDTTAPVLTLNGSEQVTIVMGSEYQDMGATAYDNYDQSVNIQTSINGDLQTKGSYIVTYQATDSSGNQSLIERNVTVLDSLPPEIYLIGEQLKTVFVDTVFVDKGAIAFDDVDSELVITTIGELDMQSLGEYELTYQVTDSHNQQVEIKRIITVVDGHNYFRTLWQTDNEGWTEDNQIKLEVNPEFTYDFSVDWGDGSIDSHVTSDIYHDYSEPGRYMVTISGLYPQMYFRKNIKNSKFTDAKKLLSIENWGGNNWLSTKQAFYGCSNLVLNAQDEPNFSLVTDMSYMFANSDFNQDISHWDVSSATNMSYMFANSDFNQDISHWDVSSVTNMSYMFASSDFNQDINNWDVSSVTDMSYMFYDAKNFNQPLDAWDVSAVTKMAGMFRNAQTFNQTLNDWDVSSVTNMGDMFYQASNFNQALYSWDVSSVTSMNEMFYEAGSFNQELNNWNVSSVTDMSHMFKNSIFFDQALNNWDVSSVTVMDGMFMGATKFNQDINNWNVSSVTNMENMFNNAKIFNQELNNWDVSSVTNMGAMFHSASSFNQDLSNWNVSSVLDMQGMFRFARIFNQPLSSWDVSSVKSMASMFSYTDSFNQELNNWDVSSVTNMRSIFYTAQSFNQDLNNWDVALVTDMSGMFYSASRFNQDLSNWDVSLVTNMNGMFALTDGFNQDLSNWNISSVKSMKSMFYNAELSTDNYDALLMSWSNQIPQDNVSFDGGRSVYSIDSLAQTARTTLMETFGWRIIDGGSTEMAPEIEPEPEPDLGSFNRYLLLLLLCLIGFRSKQRSRQIIR
ncbi:BspA family leucine-rich repeat surface protein [Marinicellulosiphila megalodicopiae]|uniref:BspA family leucine-rich repeat surface protein n=1 Tax=Marinicellulosiphila megalodicopiae TaxID=2724896 RepID=UPI003BAE5693